MATIVAMPFPRRLLNDNESIILDMHPHWWFYGPQAVSTVVLCILGLSVLTKLDGVERTLLGYLVLAAIIVAVASLIVRLVKWRTTYFAVTTYRIISKNGALARSGVEIPLNHVMNVNFKQSIFERPIGVGDLLIESGGKDGSDTFTDIDRPLEVQNLIHQAMQDQADGSFRSAPARVDLADQLERLEGLRDRGALTEEEFLAQKRRLLG